jgi:hypothetical protein
MENEQPTGSADASPIDRLEAMLSADDAPDESSTPLEAKQADVPATEPEKSDDKTPEEEPPNEYQLSDVAKLLGADESALDVDEEGNVLVKTKIDGVEGKAKFSDLLKSYQLQGHVDRQVREAAEQRKAVQEQAQAMQQQWQVQQAVIGKIAEAKAIEAELVKYQSVDWNGLYDSDPVQAVKLDRQMRDLQSKYQDAHTEVGRAASYIQEQQTHSQQATLENERQALLKALPQWSDEAISSKEKQAISADLKARGYADKDIQGLSDHKAVLLARDAMLYRQMKATNTTTEKQVRSAPKIIKPGSPQSNRSLNAVQKIKSEVRSSGSKQSVMDYLLATGKV